MELSQRLRAIRKKAGFTQTQFAALVGVSVSNYKRYELGQIMPPKAKLSTLETMLSALEKLHE